MEEIEVTIVVPVNLTGYSFIKSFMAGLMSELNKRGIQLSDEERKLITKTVTRMGHKLDEVIREVNFKDEPVKYFITGKFGVDLEKKKIIIKEITVWTPTPSLITTDVIVFDIR